MILVEGPTKLSSTTLSPLDYSIPFTHAKSILHGNQVLLVSVASESLFETFDVLLGGFFLGIRCPRPNEPLFHGTIEGNERRS